MPYPSEDFLYPSCKKALGHLRHHRELTIAQLRDYTDMSYACADMAMRRLVACGYAYRASRGLYRLVSLPVG